MPVVRWCLSCGCLLAVIVVGVGGRVGVGGPSPPCNNIACSWVLRCWSVGVVVVLLLLLLLETLCSSRPHRNKDWTSSALGWVATGIGRYMPPPSR